MLTVRVLQAYDEEFAESQLEALETEMAQLEEKLQAVRKREPARDDRVRCAERLGSQLRLVGLMNYGYSAFLLLFSRLPSLIASSAVLFPHQIDEGGEPE